MLSHVRKTTYLCKQVWTLRIGKMQKGNVIVIGGGDGHHLQKNIEQYICFREQFIKEHVKRLYLFEF